MRLILITNEYNQLLCCQSCVLEFEFIIFKNIEVEFDKKIV